MVKMPGQVTASLVSIVIVRDKYGDTTETTVRVPFTCRYAPQRTTEFVKGVATGTSAPAQLYIGNPPPGFKIKAADEVEVMGLRWAVDGDPEVWPSGRMTVKLKRFGAA